MSSDRRSRRYRLRRVPSLSILVALCGSASAQEMLPTIDVRSDASQTADVTPDYKVNRIELGPLGKKPLIDTQSPYVNSYKQAATLEGAPEFEGTLSGIYFSSKQTLANTSDAVKGISSRMSNKIT